MKTMIHTFILISALLGNYAVAQETTTKKVKATTTRKSFSQLHMGYQLWQEAIDATSAGTTSEMLTYLHGFRIGYSWHKPLRNVRWVTVYGADLGLGLAKGAAAAPLTDEVEDQSWFSITFNPGMMYRTTSKSEIGFYVPIAYRMIRWDLKAPFDLDRDSSFSVGVTGAYVSRFSLKTSMMVTVTHQQMWNATIWGIGYQYDFR